MDGSAGIARIEQHEEAFVIMNVHKNLPFVYTAIVTVIDLAGREREGPGHRDDEKYTVFKV